MRRTRTSAVLAAGVALAATTTVAPAAIGVVSNDSVRASQPAEALDVRADSAVRPTKAQLDAVADILDTAPRATRVTYDDRFGTPRTVHPTQGGTLTAPREGAPTDIARAWLDDHRAAFGLTAADISDLALTSDHRLGTGTHVVTFRQVFGGVQTVHGGSMTVTVRPNGAVESYAGQTIRHAGLTGAWEMTAAQALEQVAASLADVTGFVAKSIGTQAGYTKFARDGLAAASYVKKTVFVTDGAARPAYQVLLIKELDQAWDVVVDARTGEVLYRNSLVDHAGSEGTVYENYPGAEHGGEPVVKSFGPNEYSPSGYVDPTGLAGLPGVTTLGNNASTYANWSNFLVPADQGPRPLAPDSHFNYVYENAWGKSECQATPPSYAKDLDPAATNLFYHHNRIHDEYYRLGFTETGDNFQMNNFGVDGQGAHDPILGLVQAGALSGGAPLYTGRDNAYMLTLPDGIPPWSGMFLWEPINDAFEGPCRDGDFDAGVIQHEYSHGLSNRYVSAEDNALASHQSGSMGEGWGDWYALNYLHREGLSNGSMVGQYATGNTERGIRNWAYDDNPTTFGDLGYDITGPEVHADGEIWTATLWDYRKGLVAEFGEKRGGSIAEHTVTDAMPRSPANPSFVDMRDAIALAIDDRYHDSAAYERIVDVFWSEFARRGLGLHAASDTGDDLDPRPAFDHIDQSRNGVLSGRVVNASTGEGIEGARVMIGQFEARASSLRETGANGGFSAPAVFGTYPVTIQARGFGAHTFEGVEVRAGKTTSLRFELSPNLASLANGAKVVEATTPNAKAMLDDTEASTWATDKRGHVTVQLGTDAKITSVQVSAFTTSRFQAVKDFTLQTSKDGRVWHNAIVENGAFGYQAPRPTAPDVHYTTFELADPVRAKFVRLYLDAPMGETMTSVQAAELQVFSGNVRNVTPAPPPPPDPPYTEEGTISFGTPVGDVTSGGVTAVDFQNSCTYPPASQGSDGWVTKLPESFGDGRHQVEVVGTGPAPHDIDVYFYDADCQMTGAAASSNPDETGTIPSGTAYVLTHLWSGAGESFTLTATDTQ
jgi:extracellular elastinolytic metalloproteinase